MNAVISAALVSSNAMTAPALHPADTTSVHPSTSATSAPATSTTPGMSRRVTCADAGGLGRKALLPTAATAAIGRLTKRHQRQARYWVSAPPRRKPIAAPLPAMLP